MKKLIIGGVPIAVLAAAATAHHHKHKPTMTSSQANAVRSAEDYLDMQSFSRSGLIEQLSSSAGDGFTRAQAEYAADKVY